MKSSSGNICDNPIAHNPCACCENDMCFKSHYFTIIICIVINRVYKGPSVYDQFMATFGKSN